MVDKTEKMIPKTILLPENVVTYLEEHYISLQKLVRNLVTDYIVKDADWMEAKKYKEVP